MTPQARATALVAVALLPVTGGLVASWEGTEFTPYRDLGGVWTVCEGVTGPAVIPGKVYSRQECRDLLNGELRTHALGLAKCLTTVPPQPVLTAWISWTYNEDGSHVRRSAPTSGASATQAASRITPAGKVALST